MTFGDVFAVWHFYFFPFGVAVDVSLEGVFVFKSLMCS